ncbi:MAG TPA: hypothetical protein DDX54_02730 [Rhodospirillaceae bacterium]|jgi:predicted Zn finger-like uncharacterized protein|nr:zinc-ribbon domain-containing protein [Alphaproteobacteria bacterium]HBH26300.1 hypothetical protein [Rhodospirillaceae bacterium]
MDVLTCPECGARFAAPPGALGRNVRCGACGHVWRAGGGEESGIPEGIRPRPETPLRRPSPATAPRRPLTPRLVGYAGAAALAAAVLLALFLARGPVAEAWPQARSAYALFRAEPPAPAQSLAFDRVTAQAQGGRIALAGTILNLADQGQRLPRVEAVLRDATGAEHGRWVVPLEATAVDAQGQVPMEARLSVERALPGAPALTLKFVLF